MSLFSLFQSLWSDGCGTAAIAVTPAVNIDGTPMLNETMDIHGHPYGVIETALFDWHTTQDTSWVDCSHDFGGSCGMDASEW
jgi:hypothetical protein